jgi:inorganic triphosphatase YgiF
MIDYIDLKENSSSKKFISSYFLLRSNCEQLFEMNENNSLNPEQLKRIIQDLKTVIYSLEGIQSKPITKLDQLNTDEILFNENNLSNITSYHRFDDKIQESMDEILVCHTGKSDDEMKNDFLDIDDYDKRLLRDQTNCLMKELQTAIQGKKQEWNEREQRLLGIVENNQEESEKVIVDEQPFEKLTSMSDTISMLDELKHKFVLNRKKLNIDEDIFGEDEIENFDDDE